MSIDGESDRFVFQVGQSVTLSEEYLEQLPEKGRLYAGRVGQISGYRLGAIDPTVYFPKDGRRKEQRLFGVPARVLQVVG